MKKNITLVKKVLTVNEDGMAEINSMISNNTFEPYPYIKDIDFTKEEMYALIITHMINRASSTSKATTTYTIEIEVAEVEKRIKFVVSDKERLHAREMSVDIYIEYDKDVFSKIDEACFTLSINMVDGAAEAYKQVIESVHNAYYNLKEALERNDNEKVRTVKDHIATFYANEVMKLVQMNHIDDSYTIRKVSKKIDGNDVRIEIGYDNNAEHHYTINLSIYGNTVTRKNFTPSKSEIRSHINEVFSKYNIIVP